MAQARHVEFVIKGSIRAVPEEIRITAQLFDCPGMEALWSGSWDGPRGELVELQDRVVRSIALETDQITNFDGFYESPGSPRWHLGLRTRSDNRIATARLKEAGQWPLLEAQLQSLTEGWESSPDALLANMRSAGEERVRSAPREWGSHFYRGYAAFLSGEKDQALSSLRRSRDLAQGAPLVQGVLACALATVGESQEAIRTFESIVLESP